MKKTVKVVVGLAVVAVVAVAGMMCFCDAKVVGASAERCFASIDSLPECETGVLLGTSNRGALHRRQPVFQASRQRYS